MARLSVWSNHLLRIFACVMGMLGSVYWMLASQWRHPVLFVAYGMMAFGFLLVLVFQPWRR